MRGRLPRLGGCLAMLMLLALPSRVGATAHTCGSDAIANTASVLCAPPSGPCTATSVTLNDNIEVTSGGCTFDLGGRALQVQKTFQMVGTGFITVVNAADVTITSTGKLKARGDFNQPTSAFIQGGTISLRSSGTLTHAGVLDVSGDAAGSIFLTFAGDITVQSTGVVQGNGITSTSDAGFADGGTLQALSQGGSITDAGTITMLGNSQAGGGEVDLTAARNIDIQQTIDASGGSDDGGVIDVEAGDDVTVTKTLTVDSNVGAGFGGTITLNAGEDVLGGVAAGGSLTVTNATLRFNGSDSQSSSGDGGELDASSSGPMRFSGTTIRGNGGSLFDGSGGTVCLDSTDLEPNHIGPLDGDISIDGTVVLQSAGTSGDGGDYEASAGRNYTATATIDVSGQDTGGDVAIDAGGAIALNGAINAEGLSAIADPGSVDIFAGEASDAGVTVTQPIFAPGGASGSGSQFISLAGCALTVGTGVKVNGEGGMTSPTPNATPRAGGSEIDLIALHPMQLQANAQFLADPGGKILTFHPPGQNPVIGAGVVFNPPRVDFAAVDGPYPPCPVCGDGVRQPGEVCDNGAAADGSCCNATCDAFTCPTATRTATGPTPVATVTVAAATPTTGGTPTAAPTPTVLASATASPTATPTPVATATPTVLANPDVDHFNCYSARTAAGTAGFVKQQLTLTDAFESKRTNVLRTAAFCAPVDKDGQGIPDPQAHLQCYSIRDAAGQTPFDRRTVPIANEFGADQWLLRKSQLLCVPAQHDGGVVPPRLDRFKCYTAVTAPGVAKFAARSAVLSDEFDSKTMMVLKPFRMCEPVDQNGEGTISPAAHLDCYKTKNAPDAPRFTRRTIAAGDDLGSEQLTLQRPDFVCMPSTRSAAPHCGDGYLDPGEECDDGNAVNGDGCDANCTLEGCGNGIIDAGEQCDDGAGNGTDDCCSAACRLVDADGDGLCDRDDLCPADADNDSDGDGFCVAAAFRAPALGGDDPCSRAAGAGSWVKPKVVFGNLAGAPGTQKMTLKGAFSIPVGGAVDLRSFGVHVRVRDNAGRLVVDEHVPGGAFSSAQPIGWIAGGTPVTKWTYVDKANTPPIHNGIKKIVVTAKSATPGLLAVKVAGKGGHYALAPGQEPVAVEVALDDAATPSGAEPGTDQCGTATFRAAPATPACVFSGGTLGNAKLLCK